mmetsp:Transcript_12440/g.32309  ORF Transcript_12440/g.32309 Transcript_12440/m.32309 type:complete len:104 (-) Transcript_12440:271-582(-)
MFFSIRMQSLTNFFERGPGVPINYQISFELVRRLFSNLEDAAEHRETAKHLESGAVLKAPNADLYFGHAETLLPLLAALGLPSASTEVTHVTHHAVPRTSFQH